MTQALPAMRLRGERILAVRYTRPSAVGSLIVIPEAYREDMNNALFEVRASGDKVAAALGATLSPGDLIITPPLSATYFGRFEDVDHFIVMASEVLAKVAKEDDDA